MILLDAPTEGCVGALRATPAGTRPHIEAHPGLDVEQRAQKPPADELNLRALCRMTVISRDTTSPKYASTKCQNETYLNLYPPPTLRALCL